MPDSSKRLAGPINIAATATTFYTAPAGTTTSILGLRVVNTTTAAITFRLSIGVDAAATRLYHDVSVAAGGLFVETGLIAVLAAAETLQGLASATGMTLTISGVETT